jgi:hypothetical protein
VDHAVIVLFSSMIISNVLIVRSIFSTALYAHQSITVNSVMRDFTLMKQPITPVLPAVKLMQTASRAMAPETIVSVWVVKMAITLTPQKITHAIPVQEPARRV